ncbi:unnamed protein product [Darwinula stevensoni]|uniref:Integrin alpha-2 domain-containing protein n=1 Tax=Darwinula stevensoni TaxID=69355 RepID=A0A7R9A1Z5_9CRUS|nr:unnamed protein product [Darwinula stevensoni]CAG0887654.1 unnamed protein product [Darwinula stevensoni]
MTLKFFFAFLALLCPVFPFNVDVKHPVIFEDPGIFSGKNLRPSYFGFSVALHNHTDGDSPDPGTWVLVGAPRGNYSSAEYSYDPKDIPEPGLMYKCSLGYPSGDECMEIIVDSTGKQIQGTQIHLYSMGQAGFSVHFPPSQSEVLVGAPGVYNWKGTVIHFGEHFGTGPGYDVNSGFFRDENELLYVAGAPRAGGSQENDMEGKVFVFRFQGGQELPVQIIWEAKGLQLGEYFGSSLASGDFNGDHLTDLAVGAPLSSSHEIGDHGSVTIFATDKLNSDRSKPQEILGKRVIINGSKSPWARFGTSISCLGDINHDGYDDLAVGAPYEEGSGAVYIYLGSQTGIVKVPSQQILASSISPLLKGFGISLSRGLDMDHNKYPDIAVGSYASGHVVLLRSSPVANVSASLKVIPSHLSIDDRSLHVEACLQYSGNYVPEHVEIQVRLQFDSQYIPHRGFWETKHGNTAIHSYSQQLYKGGYNCLNFTARIHPETKDFTKPIHIDMSYQLVGSSLSIGRAGNLFAPSTHDAVTPLWIKGPSRLKRQALENKGNLDDFCKTCPVMGREIQSRTEAIVPFLNNCGDDNICLSDLSISGKFIGFDDNHPYILGSSRTVMLEMVLNNREEPAFLAKAKITLPRNVYLASGPRECLFDKSSDDEESQDVQFLICELANPLNHLESNLTTFVPVGIDKKIEKLTLEVTRIPSGQEWLNVTLQALTNSEDSNISNNIFNLSLPLVTEIDLALSGRSERDQYYFTEEKDRPEDLRGTPNLVQFVHQFTLSKYRPSPAPQVEVTFFFPLNLTRKGQTHQLIQLFPPKALLGGKPIICDVREMDRNGWTHKQETFQPVTSPPRLLGGASVTLDCSQPGISCAVVVCFVGPLSSQPPPASFLFRLQANLNIIESQYSVKGMVLYRSEGLAVVSGLPETFQPHDDWPDMATVNTLLVSGTPLEPEKVATWIYAVSIAGGILILVFIVMGLVKLGFFRRQKKEEMDAMKGGDKLLEEPLEGKNHKREKEEDNELN